jgi:hypothetical protein
MQTILIALLLCVPASAQLSGLDQQFPETPEPIKEMPYGGYAHDKAGEVKEHPALTKTFLLVHGTYLAANVFDIEMTHQGVAHHNCVEGGFDGDPHPSRGEMYAVDMTIFSVITGLDYLFAKGHPPKWFPVQYIMPGIAIGKHLKGGIDWYSRCW